MGKILAFLILLALAVAALKVAIIAGFAFYLIFYPRQTLTILYVFVLIPAAFDRNLLLGVVATVFGVLAIYTIANHADD